MEDGASSLLMGFKPDSIVANRIGSRAERIHESRSHKTTLIDWKQCFERILIPLGPPVVCSLGHPFPTLHCQTTWPSAKQILVRDQRDAAIKTVLRSKDSNLDYWLVNQCPMLLVHRHPKGNHVTIIHFHPTTMNGLTRNGNDPPRR